MKRSGDKASIIFWLALACVCASSATVAGEPPSGPLPDPQAARVVVEKLPCRCEPGAGAAADVLLVTVGTESLTNSERHFHPVVTLAFDRLLAEDEFGQWVALWNLGPSSPGAWRTFRAFFPVPVRPPQSSEKQLAELSARLERIRSGAQPIPWPAPEPYVDLTRLKHATVSQGMVMALKRLTKWFGLFNPAQLVFRTYLLHRRDRNERAFQRAYLGLSWLVEVEFDGAGEAAAWLRNLNDLRFHLLRNRSFFGRWVSPSEAFELVYGYDSHIREQLAKGSSWLQADANDYHLHYEPILRFTGNSAPVPISGVLYYDPQIAPAPGRARWPTPNVFDLSYNPFTHPKIQRLARENPEALIPLAVYVFQSDLGLRPIIVADFFDRDNPRLREQNRQGMEWLREAVTISTGFLSPERLGYQAVAFVANKKAFTPLANKSARMGVEELRLALEANLYVQPEWQRDLLHRVDKRVLNPLVKPTEVEAVLAHLQYESLRAADARAVCRVVNRVRRRLTERYRISSELPPAERWARLRAALAEAYARRRLRNLMERGFQDLGALESLDQALRYFEQNPASYPASVGALRVLHQALYQERLRLQPGPRQEEASQAAERVASLWSRAAQAQGRSAAEMQRERERTEERARSELEKEKRTQQKERVKNLHRFLRDAHDALQASGCGQSQSSLSEAETYLVLLPEIPDALRSEPPLQREFRRHERRLRGDLKRLQQTLETCGMKLNVLDAWQPEQRQRTLQLVRTAGEKLFSAPRLLQANGEN